MKKSVNSPNNQLLISLPSRSKKPRENGLSNMVDKGYGLKQLDDILSFCSDYVDIVKLGWASAYITPTLSEKVKLFNNYNIRTCLGGMMFEICFWQGKIEEYADFMRHFNIDMVEVSNGSLPISEKDKVRMIEYYANLGFTVLSEVGSKDVTVCTPPEEWVKCIRDENCVPPFSGKLEKWITRVPSCSARAAPMPPNALTRQQSSSTPCKQRVAAPAHLVRSGAPREIQGEPANLSRAVHRHRLRRRGQSQWHLGDRGHLRQTYLWQ